MRHLPQPGAALRSLARALATLPGRPENPVGADELKRRPRPAHKTPTPKDNK